MGWKGLLGFEYGVVLASMGHDVAGPELVAAVANAGALALLHAPDWESPELLRELIRKTRKLTDKPFGVGVLLAFPHKENIKVILQEKVAVLQVAWGECSKELVLEAHNAGVKVVPQVGNVEEARKAINVGVDAIIVQGYEAGGHVLGKDGLMSLLPRVVDAVAHRDIPVIAAGGIVDARGYVAALALGAKGICMGTRFLATQESYAHPTYKQKLIEHDETEYTDLFGRELWPEPHRVLLTPFVREWKSLPAHENETNQPIIGRSLIHGKEAPGQLKEIIRKTRELTDKPFGVGVILAFPHKENIKAILEEKVAVLQVFWGECSKELVLEAHNAGVKVVPQVGSLEEAKKVIDAGVDAIIVQGYEAGGHVRGQDGLISLLPRVVDAVAGRDIPLIACGGIVDARGYVAALALGAKGICMGTRFLATQESYAHPAYKQKLIEYDETEYTDLFGRASWPDAPHRVLLTPFVREWKSLPAHENETDQPVIGRALIHGEDIEFRRFSIWLPNPKTTGEIENLALYAGQSVGLIKEILPAGEVVKRLVEGAQRLIQERFNEESV